MPPQGRPSPLDDIYRPRGRASGPGRPGPSSLDDIYSQASARVGVEERGTLGRAWDWANRAPEFIAAPARQFATDVTAPTLNRGPIESWVRGFAGGAVEGVSSLFSPANVAATAAGLGAAKTGAQGLAGLSRILRGADVALAAPMAVEGAGRVLDDPLSGSAWAELGGGVLATALGARATPPLGRPRINIDPTTTLPMRGGQRQFSVAPKAPAGPLTAQEAITAAKAGGQRLTPGSRVREGFTPGLGSRVARLGEGRNINEPLRPRRSPGQVREVLEAPLAERLTSGAARSLDDIYGGNGRPAPPSGPDWPGAAEIAGTQRALEAGQPSPFANLRNFFGLDQPAAPLPTRVIDAPPAAAAGGGEPIHPKIRELWEKLMPQWRESMPSGAADAPPFRGDPYEPLEDFSRRIREAPAKNLWSKERPIRKLIDEGGFIARELAQTGAGALAGGAGGAAIAAEQGESPWLGGAAGALAGGAGMSVLSRLFRGSGAARAARGAVATPDPSGMPPRSTLSRMANMGRDAEPRGNGLLPADSPRGASSVELIDPDASLIRQNASGAPGAGSLEEMGRARQNAAAARAWVVYDRAGTRRALDPLVGQDYQVRPGESFGLEGPEGFVLHDDLGGRYPKGGGEPTPRLGDRESRPAFDPTGRSTVDLGAVDEGVDPFARAIRESGDSGFVDVEGMGAGAKKMGEGLERLGYFSMLGHPSTIAKGHLGAGSAALFRAAEEGLAGRPRRGMDILKNLFRPGAREAYVRALREGSADPTATRWGATAGPLGLPSRLMAAPDAFVTEAMLEAGIPLESAKQSAFTAEPRTKTGRAVVDLQRSLGPIARTIAFPFARTGVNIMERGIERTPGLGLLMEAFQPPATRSAGRDIFARQALGAGVAAGAYSLTGSNDEEGISPWWLTALGPGAIPAAIGQAVARSGRPATGRVSPSSRALQEIAGATLAQSPLPSEGWQLDRLIDPRTWPARFVPRSLSMLTDPSAFETPGVLDPTIARIPWLNELMLDPRMRGRTRSLPRVGRPLPPVGSSGGR